ncbi:MAG: PIG-L family deacetylase [Syntrophaceae bacterium]|nr:PIG-L family deacetylase [Syntrophaceae bacterium]
MNTINEKKLNILVVAAHPDDEVLGCGGTIAKYAKEGWRVSIVILGEGISSRYESRSDADTSQLDNIKETSKGVAKLLGAAEVMHHDLPDNRFDTVPLLDVVKLIEDHVQRIKPQIVFTHHSGDLNVDHSVVARATLSAVRPIRGTAVRTLLAYEVPSATDWSFGSLGAQFSPNTFYDIGGQLELKLKAMSMYESELRPFPHPRSIQAIQAAAVRWGAVAGIQAAEAFQIVHNVV